MTTTLIKCIYDKIAFIAKDSSSFFKKIGKRTQEFEEYFEKCKK